MKAIAIVELPNDADLTKCRANINIEKVRECGYDYEPYTFRLYCPLRPIPKKKLASNKSKIETSFEYVHGFNDCIREITGETE